MNSDGVSFMKMALDLAEKGAGFVSPNPLVGAVVVKNGQVVGRGYHQRVGEAHGEINALDDAGEEARESTLYVTLEPCNHTGRTPPCTERILSAGVKKVVIAMDDPNPGVKGKGADYLRSHGIVVETGVCEDEARKQNEIFTKFVTTGQPFVLVKCAATLDGRIASRTGDSKWISGEKSREYVHRLRHRLDAILVGSGTVLKDDPSLTARLADISTRDPLRVIIDTYLTIPESAKLLHQESNAETIIFHGDFGYALGGKRAEVMEEKSKRICKDNVRTEKVCLKNGRVDLSEVMEKLALRNISSVLIEGGSRIIASAFSDGIVDKVNFFYAPKILGGEGISICNGPGPETMSECIPLRDIDVKRFGDDVLIGGYVAK